MSIEDKAKEAEKRGKKKPIHLSLNTKVKLLDELAAGEPRVELAKKYGVDKTTVGYMGRFEEYIRNSHQLGSENGNKITTMTRPLAIELMEIELYKWLVEKMNNNEVVRNDHLRAKAVDLFAQLKGNDETIKPFKASINWVYWFKARFGVRCTDKYGIYEMPVNNEICEKFRNDFKAMIAQMGYKPEQVFNLSDFKLYWKRSTIEGLNDGSYWASVTLCCNALGDFVLKPLIVCLSQLDKGLKSTISITIARELTKWYRDYFIPSVGHYLNIRSLPFKVLLLVDSLSESVILKDLYDPHIKVHFFSSMTNKTLQPLEQGIISKFKINYLKGFLKHLRTESKISLPASYIAYNWSNCLEVIQEAVNKLTRHHINSCWKSLWPEVFTPNVSLKLPDESLELKEILHIIHQFNFSNAKSIEINHLKSLIYDRVESSDKKSKPLENSKTKKTSKSGQKRILQRIYRDSLKAASHRANLLDKKAKNLQKNVLTKENHETIVAAVREFESLVRELDPSRKRAAEFLDELNKLLKPYKIESRI